MLRIRLTAVIFTFRGAVVAEYFSLFTQSYPEGTLGFVERQLRNAKNGHPENQVSENTSCARACSLASRAMRNAPAVLYCFTSSIRGVVRQALEMSLAVYRVAASQSVSR